MVDPAQQDDKPRRLYKQSLLAMVDNAVGSRLFTTFFVELPDGKVIDAFDGGQASCAAFVSGILTMLGKLKGFHGTVDSVIKDLLESGWQQVPDIRPADVIVWLQPKQMERHLAMSGLR